MQSGVAVSNVSIEQAKACILLVEDEVLVRMMVAEHLLERGFKVIEAATGDEAAEALMTGARVDIVLSDVQMPPGLMDGLGLLDFVRKHRAGVPVVLCSGTLLPEEAMNRGVAAFIAKPFVLPNVEMVLRTLLKQHDG